MVNEEQLKEITILAKELGFKAKTISTIITFKELFEENNKVLLSNNTCYYLLLCEIQLWLISKRIFVEIKWVDDFFNYFIVVKTMDNPEWRGIKPFDSIYNYEHALATGILEGLKLIKNENN